MQENLQKIGEKGIWYLTNQNHGVFLWKNDFLFTYEEIEHYKDTGEEKKDLHMLLPIFSKAEMALQYARRNNLKDVVYGLIGSQERWIDILKMAVSGGAENIVINPCIDAEPHECNLFTYPIAKAAEADDFEGFNSSMKDMELIQGQGGYNIKINHEPPSHLPHTH